MHRRCLEECFQHQLKANTAWRFHKLQPAGAANSCCDPYFPDGAVAASAFGSSHIVCGSHKIGSKRFNRLPHQEREAVLDCCAPKNGRKRWRLTGPSPTRRNSSRPWKKRGLSLARETGRNILPTSDEKHGPKPDNPPRRAAGCKRAGLGAEKATPECRSPVAQNRAYAEKFGYVFLICAPQTHEEIRTPFASACQTIPTLIAYRCEEHRKITRLRRRNTRAMSHITTHVLTNR